MSSSSAALLLVLLGAFSWGAAAGSHGLRSGAEAVEEADAQPVVFLPHEFGRVGVPRHPDAQAWLRQHFANASQRGDAALQLQQPCSSTGKRPARQPRSLVLAAVGDAWDASMLLSQPESAHYDLAVIYYGTSPDFSCARCKHTFRQRGLKWQLVRQLAFSEAWEQLLQAGQFKYVLIADDDLRISTPSLNTFFSIVAQYSLLLAQPSVCRLHNQTGPTFPLLLRHPLSKLRFVNYVEVMAPTFEINFFQQVVRRTIEDREFGWGLDTVWAAILGFKGVAVVDEICMYHPPKQESRDRATSIYKAGAKMQPSKEKATTLAAYNLTAADVGSKAHKTFAEVPGGVKGSWAVPCEEAPSKPQQQLRLRRAAMERQDQPLLAVPLWPAVGVAVVMAACVLALQRQLKKSGRQHSPRAPGHRQAV